MEVATCREPLNSLAVCGEASTLRKAYAFLLAEGVDSFPQIRYRLIVGSVAACTTFSNELIVVKYHVKNLYAQ